MKIKQTYIVFDRGKLSCSKEWSEVFRLISSSTKKVVWPPDYHCFRIPKRVDLKQGDTYINRDGHRVTVTDPRGYTLRNGVPALKSAFTENMRGSGWLCETKLHLKAYFEQLSKHPSCLTTYPDREKPVDLQQSVGPFDFWLQTPGGFKTVIEWESGNISSSHRSVNKMCMAMSAGLVDAGVLMTPSRHFYPQLTDRIGNIRELEPYMNFWNRYGELVSRGLLVIIAVEHDEDYDSRDQRDFLKMGFDGLSTIGRRSTRRVAIRAAGKKRK